jgi:hypothetical protein
MTAIGRACCEIYEQVRYRVNAAVAATSVSPFEHPKSFQEAMRAWWEDKKGIRDKVGQLEAGSAACAEES